MSVVDAAVHSKLLDATQWTADEEDLLGGLQLNARFNFCEISCPHRTLTSKCHLKSGSMDPALKDPR